MIDTLDIKINASSQGVGPEVREVVSVVDTLRDAVRETATYLQDLKATLHEVFGGSIGGAGASHDVEELERNVRELRTELEMTQHEMADTSRASREMGNTFAGIKDKVIGFAIGYSFVELGKQIVDAAADFEKLRGVLATLEPAQGVAAARFEDLRKVAATTPFSLEEVVEAFAKLKAMGLDPGTAAIVSYGNTSSAMGKSLNQMIEAVADAATFQFERLKEFGIIARQQGNDVTFTFQGVSTKVGKNAVEIQEYLEKIGNVNFAGAMERQSATFNGMMSNLEDNLSNVANEIGEGGLMAALKGIVTDMNNASGSSGDWATMLGGVLGTTITTIWQMIQTFGETVGAVFHTLGDIIRSFTGSTQNDGQILQTIIKALELVFVALGTIVQVTFSIIGGVLREALSFFSSTFSSINAMLHFDFSGAVAATEKWRSDTVKIAQDTYSQIEEITKSSNARMAAIQAPSEKKGAAAALPGYVAPPPQPAATKKKKGGAESEVGIWANDLHQMEIASGDFFRDNTQMELDFWTSKLDKVKQGSKEWYDIQDKIFAAAKSLAQQHYQQQTAALDFEIQSAQGNYTKQSALEQEKVDLVRRTYGEQSSQYQNALREQERMSQQHEQELTRIRQQAVQQRQQIDQNAAQTDLTLQQGALQRLSALIEDQESAGLMGRREAVAEKTRIALAEVEARRESEQRIYEITRQSLQDQLALENLKPQERARIDADIEKEAAAHVQRMRVLTDQQMTAVQQGNLAAANATRQVWTDRLNPVTQALTGMVNSFLTGTTSVRQAMLQMGSQILQQLNGWVLQWVQQHVVAQQTVTASTVAGNVARTTSNSAAAATQAGTTAVSATGEISTNAAVAGSGALASISKIPVIGPFIAPAIAAGIMALAMGFIGRIASAEGGWGQVPFDGMQTELHKDEMVLPASIASPLRDALSNRDSTWSLGTTGMATRQTQEKTPAEMGNTQRSVREGDTHVHVSALDTRSGVEWLMKNRRAIGQAMGKTYREGNR